MHDFIASKVQILKFTQRHTFQSVALLGEDRSSSAENDAIGMMELRQKLSSFDKDFILNTNETGLFYKLQYTNKY